jgi:hypothetical protein
MKKPSRKVAAVAEIPIAFLPTTIGASPVFLGAPYFTKTMPSLSSTSRLVRVELVTGLQNQIRPQFSVIGRPR